MLQDEILTILPLKQNNRTSITVCVLLLRDTVLVVNIVHLTQIFSQRSIFGSVQKKTILKVEM